MIRGIDHVGLAVADLPAAAAGMALLDLKSTYEGTVDSYGVACQFWQHDGDSVAIELVAPARDDAAVLGQLARRGPGLHHVAFEVEDIDSELAVLRERGAVLVDAEPCPGGRAGLRVAFVHLGPAAGLLVELVDYGRHRAEGGPPWSART